MSETGRNLLTLSFWVKEHIEHTVDGVKIWDTVLEHINNGSRLRLRGYFGELGDKLDFREQPHRAHKCDDSTEVSK